MIARRALRRRTRRAPWEEGQEATGRWHGAAGMGGVLLNRATCLPIDGSLAASLAGHAGWSVVSEGVEAEVACADKGCDCPDQSLFLALLH